MPSGTGRLVSGHLSGQWPAGLSVGAVQSRRLVSTESGQGSIRPPATHPRSGPCPTPVWLSADLGVAAARRLVSESQAGASALPSRWFAVADASAPPEAYRIASWSSPDPDWSDGALEHGFRA